MFLLWRTPANFPPKNIAIPVKKMEAMAETRIFKATWFQFMGRPVFPLPPLKVISFTKPPGCPIRGPLGFSTGKETYRIWPGANRSIRPETVSTPFRSPCEAKGKASLLV